MLILAMVSTVWAEPFDYPEIKWGVGRQTVKDTETHRLLYETETKLMYEADATPFFFAKKAYDYYAEADHLGQISYHYITIADMNLAEVMQHYIAKMETLIQAYGLPSKIKAEQNDYSKIDVDQAYLQNFGANPDPEILGFRVGWRLDDMEIALYCVLQDVQLKAEGSPIYIYYDSREYDLLKQEFGLDLWTTKGGF